MSKGGDMHGVKDLIELNRDLQNRLQVGIFFLVKALERCLNNKKNLSFFPIPFLTKPPTPLF